MVIACLYVVDGVCSGFPAEVADALISTEDYEATGGPIFWKPLLSSGTLPPGSLMFLASSLPGGFFSASF